MSALHKWPQIVCGPILVGLTCLNRGRYDRSGRFVFGVSTSTPGRDHQRV